MPRSSHRHVLGASVLAATLGLAASPGCVSKKDHEALQAELDQTRGALEGQVAERNARIGELEGQLEDERTNAQKQKAQMEQFLAEREKELMMMEQQRLELETKLAELLKDRSKLKASVAEMEEALADLNKRKLQAEKRLAAYREMLDRFKPLIDAGKLKVKIVDGRMVLELPTDILFASGSARLSDEGAEALTEVGKVLADLPDRHFQIEGHTDNVPIRSKRYKNNWELASGRAQVVLATLLDAGVAPTQLSAASYGEHKPTVPNDSDANKARNRRIEIAVVPDLSDLPGFDELTKLGGS